jgi:hypothetical protein
LAWVQLHGRVVLQDGEEERVVSLYSWCEMVIVNTQTQVFFDEVLYQKCPDLLEQFQIYEDESWKLPFGLPDVANEALRPSKSSIEKGLEQYQQIPRD